MKVDEIFVVSERCVTIVHKCYTLSCNNSARDIFLEKLKKGEHQTLPYFTDGNTWFHFIKRDRLYFVATTNKDTSPILVIEILTRLYHVFKDFCGVVSEDSLLDNLLLIMEVLNEFMDFGLVQLSTTEKLQPHIQSTPVLTRLNRQPTQDITSRVFGIERKSHTTPATDIPVISSPVNKDKRKNELFVDLIERITSVINADGSISRLEIQGAMKVKNFLYGSPQLKIILNDNIIVQRNSRIKAYGDNVQLDSCVFHESAKVDNSDSPQVLTICPHIGEFTLMSYSMSGESSITSPFHFVSSVQPIEQSRECDLIIWIPTLWESKSISPLSDSDDSFDPSDDLCLATSRDPTLWIKDMMVTLRLKSRLPVPSVNVHLKFGVPQSVSNISQHLDGPDQTAALKKRDGTIQWTLKTLPPQAETVAQFRLINQSGGPLNREDVGPVHMKFEISGCLLSGMKIKTVKILNQEQTSPQKWLRYITVSDSFLVKLV